MKSEHAEQVNLMANLSYKRPDIYEHVFAIPNGGLRHARVASQLSGEGVKRGVPDVALMVARGSAHGLFVELKVVGGRVSKEQRAWHERLREQGYRVEVCYGSDEAYRVVTGYYDNAVVRY